MCLHSAPLQLLVVHVEELLGLQSSLIPAADSTDVQVLSSDPLQRPLPLSFWQRWASAGSLAMADTQTYDGVGLSTANSSACTNLTTNVKIFRSYQSAGICFFLSLADDPTNNKEVSVLQLSLPNTTMHIGLNQRRVEVITSSSRIRFSHYVDYNSWMLICVSNTESVIEVSIDGTLDSSQDMRNENLNMNRINDSSLCLGSSASAWFQSFRGTIVLNQISLSLSPLQLDECNYSFGDITFSSEPGFFERTIMFDVAGWNLSNGATKFTVPMTSVCKKDELEILVQIFGNYFEHRSYCSVMGGSMAFEITDNMFDVIEGKCREHKGKDSLWLATRLDEPLSLDLTCKVKVDADDADDDYRNQLYCLESVYCSLCRMPKGKLIYRYGMDDQFDREFQLKAEDGILKLVGKSSSLTFKNSEWVLHSKVHSRKMTLQKTHSPLGRNSWTLDEGTSKHEERNYFPNEILINRKEIQSMEQTFSPCLQGEFCCTNGQCIGDDKARCDGFVHCRDRSDEVNCVLIEKSEGYVISQSPSIAHEIGGDRKRVLNLLYILNINHIAKIYSVNSEIKIDFSLGIVWRDERLVFWNLHGDKNSQINDVWTPNLVFKAETRNGLKLSVSEQSKEFVATPLNRSTRSQPFNNSYMGKK
ncbi:Low-density lipoprotein (LDL) receptor class A repeat [Trinorchestia longiramus]|nr:Low-density lipoprotein (LDL) receptor class A repeat [Trinorchestia longiramus]